MALSQNFRFMQLVNVVSFFDVYWPSLMSRLWEAIRFLTSELVQIPSLGCMLPHTVFAELVCIYAIPYAVAVIAMMWPLLTWIVLKILTLVAEGWAQTFSRRMLINPFDMMQMLVWFYALFFNTLIQKGFILFTCARSPNGLSTVSLYPNVECPGPSTQPDQKWLEILPFAVMYCATIGFGMVAAVFYGGLQVRKAIAQESDRGKWAFVAAGFRDADVCWPAIILLKDLLINISVALLSGFGSFQLLAAAAISGLYAHFCLTRHPFDNPVNNMLEVWCSFSVFGLCLLAAGLGFPFDIDGKALKMLGGDIFQKTSLFAFHIVTIAIALILMLVTPFYLHAQRRASELKQSLVVEEKDLLKMDDADLQTIQSVFLRSRPLSKSASDLEMRQGDASEDSIGI